MALRSIDLMIGDWVRVRLPWHCPVDGHTENRWYTHRVTGVQTYGPDADTIYIGAAGVLPRDIEPLPLTPEILEKNGWDPITYKIEGAENVHCRPVVVAKDYVVFEVSCGWGAYPVVFVHQLQHLLRLFEIDKEIEL